MRHLALQSTPCNNWVQTFKWLKRDLSTKKHNTQLWQRVWFKYLNFVDVPISANVGLKFTQAIVLRKDCQWTRLTTHLSKPSWWWKMMINLALVSLSSPSLSWVAPLRQTEIEQRNNFVTVLHVYKYLNPLGLLLSISFYYTHVLVSKLKLSILCQRKTPIIASLWSKSNKEGKRYFLEDFWNMLIFKLVLTVGAIPAQLAPLIRELFFSERKIGWKRRQYMHWKPMSKWVFSFSVHSSNLRLPVLLWPDLLWPFFPIYTKWDHVRASCFSSHFKWKYHWKEICC